MVNKDSFIDLMDMVVSHNYHNQVELYDLFKEDSIDSLLRGEDIIETDVQINGFNQMGLGVVEVIESISLIAGTFSSIVHIVNYFREKKKNSKNILQDYWASQLVASGLPINIANHITERHNDELGKWLLANHLGPSSSSEILLVQNTQEDVIDRTELESLKMSIPQKGIRNTILCLFEYAVNWDVVHKNHLIIISANFERLEKANEAGIISNNDLVAHENKIIKRLIEFIDNL